MSGIKKLESSLNHTSDNEILEAQIRECYGRVVWTHKTHEKCSDILDKRNSKIKLFQIVLSALITTGIFVTVFGDKEWVGIVSAIISVILLILNTYTKKYDLGEIAQKHANCAANLWNIRESYLSLLTDIRADAIDTDTIRKERDKLQSELYNIYKGSPRTLGKAYNKASKALKSMEEMTFSDAEIDSFLPKELRKIQTEKGK